MTKSAAQTEEGSEMNESDKTTLSSASNENWTGKESDVSDTVRVPREIQREAERIMNAKDSYEPSPKSDPRVTAEYERAYEFIQRLSLSAAPELCPKCGAEWGPFPCAADGCPFPLPAAAPSAVEEVKARIMTGMHNDDGKGCDVVEASFALDLAKRLDSFRDIEKLERHAAQQVIEWSVIATEEKHRAESAEKECGKWSQVAGDRTAQLRAAEAALKRKDALLQETVTVINRFHDWWAIPATEFAKKYRLRGDSNSAFEKHQLDELAERIRRELDEKGE